MRTDRQIGARLPGIVERPELAYIVEVESYRAKLGGADELARVTFRTTSIFRPEGDAWKVVHRHADPITTARRADSVIQN